VRTEGPNGSRELQRFLSVRECQRSQWPVKATTDNSGLCGRLCTTWTGSNRLFAELTVVSLE
jgi:hypothetical protein